MTRRGLLVLLIFTAAAVAVVAALDQASPWKRLQLDALEARRALLEAEVAARAAALEEELEPRREALRTAEEELADRGEERRELERERFRLERQLERARRRRAAARNEEARREARIEVESFEELLEERSRRLEALTDGERAARAALKDAERPLVELRAELAGLERGRLWRRLPGLRYLAPSLAVRELAPRAFEEAGRPRVERCTTCHLGMAPDSGAALEEAGADSVAFRRHPALPGPLGPAGDASAAHSPARLGCTSCHGGDGFATDLAAAGHLPRDEATAERWRRDWRWRRGAVGEPILAGPLVEAGCVSCHGGDVWIAGAPVQQRGRRLVARLGCADCHRTGRADLDSAPPVGGGLGDLARRSSGPRWLESYLAAPRLVWPGSVKPALWAGVPEEERRVEIAVLVAELWRRSLARSEGAAAAPAGLDGADPVRGEALFDSLGCAACHVGQDSGGGSASKASKASKVGEVGEVASSLGRVDQRREAGWLAGFLAGFEAVEGGAGHRPRLRLTSQESADLAVFLAPRILPGPNLDDPNLDSGETGAAEGPAAEGPAAEGPAVDAAVRDRLLLASLEEETTIEAARALLESLDEDGRNRQLADFLLERYACASCHRIPGGAEPTAASDRAAVGERLARRLERGDAAPATWLHTSPGARHLGDLDLAPRDSDALFVQLLGWRPSALDKAPSELAAGRAVFERHGCRACHRIEGAGGEVGGAPPFDALVHRLRSDWLVDYLRDPSRRVRPEVSMRMPDFELEPPRLDAVVDYFAARAGRPRTASAVPDRSEEARRRAEAVGEAIFEVLQCGRCHGLDPGAEPDLGDGSASGLPPIHSAPDYRLTSKRLRPAWLLEALLAAEGEGFGGAMPTLFPRGPAGRADASYLAGSLSAPMFSLQRQRLLRHFDGEDELFDYISDAERSADAVRAYLWSLGED